MLILAIAAGLIASPPSGPVGHTAAASRPITLVGPGATQNGRWEEVDFGGGGLVETENGVLTLGAGDPLTAVRWVPSENQPDSIESNAGKPNAGKLPKSNYRLTWQARRTLGSDFFSTVTFPVGDDACSLVLGGWGGTLTGLSSLNEEDASTNATSGTRRFEADRWYRFAITVLDSQLSATCDGQPLFEPVDPREYLISLRTEMLAAGPLSIASYLSSGEVREMTITPIGALEEKSTPRRRARPVTLGPVDISPVHRGIRSE